MTRYLGPKTDPANVATQSDVGGSTLSDATPDALTPDQAGAAGTSSAAARADHAHEIACAAAGAILPDDVAAEGTASSFARSDHTHSITTASAGTISGTAGEGSASSFARSDHNHALGANVVGTTQIADSAVTKAKVDATIFGKAQTISALTGAGTLTASNLGQLVTVNSASAVNLTISGTILAAGERIDILQLGAGQVTLAGTLNTVVGTPGLKLRAQYSACTLYGLGGGTHVAIGDLAA